MSSIPVRGPHAVLPFEVAAELMGLSVWRIDLRTGRVHANAHGFAMTGIDDPPPFEEGLPLALLRDGVHPDDVARLAAASQQALEPGAGVIDAVARYRQPDGSYRTLLSRRIAERDASGQAIGLIGCSLDVTDQHEARHRMHAAERRAAMAAEFAGFGVWQYDLVTRERYWDAQMFRLRGVDPTTNPSIETVRIATTSDEGREAMQASMDEIARRVNDRDLPENYEPTTVEFEIVRTDGSKRWLCSKAMVVREEGRNPALLGLHWDITDAKQAEELRRQRAAAEEANRAKSRFLANMSHEIRTPMNAILGMAHLALRTGLDGQQRNYVEKIERSATALLGLINEILDFSKIEADKIELERTPFSLDDVLKDLANLVGLQAGQKGLELVFAVPPALPDELIGDPMRLGQVLVNLAANAVKFTERGEVVLTIETLPTPAAQPDALALRFTISDSGRGMSAHHLERLFQPFEQADASTSRQHGGTGLGLAISQRLVQAMGGRLEVDSAPGRGSRFAFDAVFGLPAPGATRAPPAPGFGGERVLVVDDHAQARGALVELCNACGLRALGVADAHQADTAVRREPFDVMLIDAEIPGVDSVTWATQRGDGIEPPPAIVLMCAASAREAVQRRCADAEFPHWGLLAKPVLPSTLREAVLIALGRPLPERPSASAQRARGADAERYRERMRGVRVLLVDDNDINQELASEILRSAGMQVSVAADGRAAIDALARQPCDIVLMDCQMPVMDGYEATEELRLDPRYATLPIIAMTANVMSGDRDRALASGMNDHIAKPIDVAGLFETLDRWVAPGRQA